MKPRNASLTNDNVAFRLHLIISCLILMTIGRSVSAVEDPNTNAFPTTTLSNGIEIPLVGLGCASGVRKQQVLTALEAGYRFLDTAQAYQWGYTERDVAAAIQESPHVRRQDVFVTTKVHPENLGYQAMKRAVQTSLDLPGFEGYLDAVLIHKPRCWEGACTKKPEGTWQEAWVALEEYYDAGLVKAIGICDVNDQHMLNELMGQRIKPHIIQNWFDPFHQEPSIRTKIQANGILYQGYSTLGAQWSHFKGLSQNPVHTSPQLKEIAQRHGTSVGPAQVVIQWATRKGISVIPASRDAQRQAQNLHASFQFELTADELQALDDMDGKAPKPSRPDPNQVSMTFLNQGDLAVEAYWLNADSGEEVLLGAMEASKSQNFNSHHGHTFVFRDAGSKGEIMRHTVSRHDGPKQEVLVGDMDEEL